LDIAFFIKEFYGFNSLSKRPFQKKNTFEKVFLDCFYFFRVAIDNYFQL